MLKIPEKVLNTIKLLFKEKREQWDAKQENKNIQCLNKLYILEHKLLNFVKNSSDFEVYNSLIKELRESTTFNYTQSFKDLLESTENKIRNAIDPYLSLEEKMAIENINLDDTVILNSSTEGPPTVPASPVHQSEETKNKSEDLENETKKQLTNFSVRPKLFESQNDSKTEESKESLFPTMPIPNFVNR